MKTAIVSIIIAVSSIFSAYANETQPLPSNYQNLKATSKQELLWNRIEESKWDILPPLSGKGWASIIENLKSLISLATTFNHVSDEIPAGRKKFIHTYGSVAKVSFKPFSNPYTGIFKSGAIGLVRLSLAGNPESIGFTPGMALKFLINGRPSLNIFAMHSLNGQGQNTNWFSNDFSNIIPRPTGFALKMLEIIFNNTHNPSNHLPVNHLAAFESNGSAVASPKVPYQLIFKPSRDMRILISSSSQRDFRNDLELVHSNARLYDVYAIESELSDKEVLIGALETETPFVHSYYGDKKLFFQHHH
jgi:hypothetical protein